VALGFAPGLLERSRIMTLGPSGHEVATHVVPVWRIRDFQDDDLERAVRLLLRSDRSCAGRRYLTAVERSASKNDDTAIAAAISRAYFHCSRIPHTNVARHAKAKTKVKNVVIRPASERVFARRCSMWYAGYRMDRSEPRRLANAEYPATANGILAPETLRLACRHVWRDANSTTMLGADVLNSEPVSYDDARAFTALKRHIAAAGPRVFIEEVLPNLGFGRPVNDPNRGDVLTCARCGKAAVPLHLGCPFCEDCCDCRPAGT
jgi:hypothetical protein